ncbi:MAG: NADH-quinone oxidoreductase subunit C [Candidatus Thermoplasmatota archaeon]
MAEIGKVEKLTTEEFIEKFKLRFGETLKESRIETRIEGAKKNKFNVLWLKIDRKIFREFVKFLTVMAPYPHLAVVSGVDLGETIELIYHFSIYYGEHFKELSVNLCVELPKSDLRVDSICDIVPGALITEREKQEMLGVTIENIPDKRRIFLPEDFPEGIYPWRKDETGIPDKMIKKLSEAK